MEDAGLPVDGAAGGRSRPLIQATVWVATDWLDGSSCSASSRWAGPEVLAGEVHRNGMPKVDSDGGPALVIELSREAQGEEAQHLRRYRGVENLWRASDLRAARMLYARPVWRCWRPLGVATGASWDSAPGGNL